MSYKYVELAKGGGIEMGGCGGDIVYVQKVYWMEGGGIKGGWIHIYNRRYKKRDMARWGYRIIGRVKALQMNRMKVIGLIIDDERWVGSRRREGKMHKLNMMQFILKALEAAMREDMNKKRKKVGYIIYNMEDGEHYIDKYLKGGI